MRLLHPVGVRNDKFRIAMARRLLRRRGHLTTSCHRERSVAICWQWDCRQLAMRLLLSFHSIAGDKNREQVVSDDYFLQWNSAEFCCKIVKSGNFLQTKSLTIKFDKILNIYSSILICFSGIYRRF